MTGNETTPGTGIFDKLYAAAKTVYDEAKKPLIRKQIKRKLSSAYDDAGKKIIEANVSISKSRENFEDYNINSVLDQKAVIAKCELLQEHIKAEYLELFGKEMPIGDD